METIPNAALMICALWLEATRDASATITILASVLALVSQMRLNGLVNLYGLADARVRNAMAVSAPERRHIRLWRRLRNWLMILAGTAYALTMIVHWIWMAVTPY